MPACLFCLREHEHLTDEHVFPASLGGDLVLEQAACVSCNNGFSKAFEQAIAKEFVDFRRLLLIPDRYGKVPELRVKVEVDGKTLDGKLLVDKTIQLKPVVTVIKQNGIVDITHEHVTERQKEELRKKAVEEGWELTEGVTEGREVGVTVSGDLKFIDSPELLRCVAKIAYTALALRMSPTFAKRDLFAGAREYISVGNGIAKARLFLNDEYMDACQQGPHQHSVILGARSNRHSIDAIVRLFCGIAYLVNLTDRYQGVDFFNTLVYDAQRGEENKVLFANEQAELLQLEEVDGGKATVWNDRVKSGEWFLRFLAAAMKAELKE
jgi:hypothetical protein